MNDMMIKRDFIYFINCLCSCSSWNIFSWYGYGRGGWYGLTYDSSIFCSIDHDRALHLPCLGFWTVTFRSLFSSTNSGCGSWGFSLVSRSIKVPFLLFSSVVTAKTWAYGLRSMLLSNVPANLSYRSLNNCPTCFYMFRIEACWFMKVAYCF